MVTANTFTVEISPRLYFAINSRKLNTQDNRTLSEIVSLAVKHWLGEPGSSRRPDGYRWRSLYLPHGTELRLRYKRIEYTARVVGNALMFESQAVSPREFGLIVCGCVRNVWRDGWIRRTPADCWTKPSLWRADGERLPYLPLEERRRIGRRATD
jgi:hypothetical protein